MANGSRIVIPLLLFVIFFYFFGLSSLKKGSAQDVVAVSEFKTDLSQTAEKHREFLVKIIFMASIQRLDHTADELGPITKLTLSYIASRCFTTAS